MIPQNEMGVIVLFSQRAKEAGITILEIQPLYPDARIEKNGKEYLVEFEYKSSSFVAHGHDIRRCDLIICWENDYQSVALPVVELSNDNWVQSEFVSLSSMEKELLYWKQRALASERRLTDIMVERPLNTRQRISEILAENNGLTSAVIAGMVGVSAGRVRQIRQTLAANGKS